MGDDPRTNDEGHKWRTIVELNERMSNDCIDVRFQVHKSEQGRKVSDPMPLTNGLVHII